MKHLVRWPALVLATSLPAPLLGAPHLGADTRLPAPPPWVLRGDLARRAQALIAQEDGERELRVIVRFDLPDLNYARLREARDMLEPFSEIAELKRDELVAAEAALQSNAELIHAPVRELVELHGGRVTHSFWILPAVVASIPANSIAALAREPLVLSIELDHDAHADAQNCGTTPPSQWSGFRRVPTILNGPNRPNRTVFVHGGESPIQQDQARIYGYTGSAVVPGYPGVFRVPVAIADSGFDLETDQWRAAGCWCPPTTLDVLPGCPTPSYGVHGAFTARFGWANCVTVDRVRHGDPFTLDVWDLEFPGLDGFNTPNNVIWEAGINFTEWIHGTAVTSLAAGNFYLDTRGDTSPSNCTPWCYDVIGPGQCGINGMAGVASEAELHLLKIVQDQPAGGSLISVMIRSLERAAAGGAWVYNLSYSGDPDPLSSFSIAADRAGTEFDLVIVGSAGNTGGSGSPVQVNKGYYNGLIVGATGMNGAFRDAVAPASSHGPLAWTQGAGTVTSLRDGVNVCAPGGYWSATGVSDGMSASAPDSTFTSTNSYGFGPGIWAAGPNMVGTSFASPLVTGGVAALLGAEVYRRGSATRPLNSREVRAIVLGQADQSIAAVPLNVTNGEGPRGFGQGRLDVLATADFFYRGGVTFRGSLSTAQPSRNYVRAFTQGQQVEVTLTWDRVAFPSNDYRCSNLRLEVFSGIVSGGTTVIIPLASSDHPENNYERVVFTVPNSGPYTIRARVPPGGFVGAIGGGAPVPFAIAVL